MGLVVPDYIKLTKVYSQSKYIHSLYVPIPVQGPDETQLVTSTRIRHSHVIRRVS